MNQGAYLSKTLWIYRERGEYVDVTLVCHDKKIPAHITVLAPLLSYFGIKYHCIEDVPGVIILPELKSEEVQEALRSLYAECKILRFQDLLDSHSFAVKAELLEEKQGTGTVSKRVLILRTWSLIWTFLAFLGPYWVLIYISGSLFSLFWLHLRKECQFFNICKHWF